MELIRAILHELRTIRGMLDRGVTITIEHDTEVHRKLDTLIARGERMATDLTHIKASVEAIKGRAASIEALVIGLGALVRQIPTTDPVTQAAIDTLAAELDTEAAGMQTVIDANPLPHEAPPAPVVLADGEAGADYSVVLDKPPGAAPFAFTVVGGSLPGGLTLDLTSGLLAGKPGTAGSYSFTVSVTDSDPTTPDVVTAYTLKIA